MRLRTILCTSALTLLSTAVLSAAQAGVVTRETTTTTTTTTTNHIDDKVIVATGRDGKPLPSPRHLLTFTHAGDNGVTKITISYGAPSVRGRTIYGDVVPYDRWWRAGANEATSLITDRTIRIGDLLVPAGSYTLDVLPTASGWQLIVNKQTGQWGTQYDPNQDLGRVPMDVTNLPSPQETLSYNIDHETPHSAMLHIRWADKDAAVAIEFPRS